MFELRDAADLTQEALAEKSGVSERTIQRMEDPEDDIEPRYATREKLAKVLKVKPDDFLPAAVEPDTATNGDTPDLMSSVSGGSGSQPDDLQAIRDRLDLIIDYFGIEQTADGNPTTRFAAAFEARRVRPAKPSGKATAKRT
jgi:transcriptional regulator with XRE-family HTH domain